MQQFSDSHILATAQTNKTKALELAFDNYWELLFRHAYRKLQSDELAKDVVQEVFIAMWENLEKLTAQNELLPYLYAVLRNRILIQYKKNSVRLRYAVDHAKKEESFEPSSHQLLLNKELQSIINDEISKMPSRMREIYSLKKEGDCSIKEISEKLSLSEQTVKNQLQNASNRLKQRLNCYDPSLFKIGLIISGVYTILP
ncbi:MAG TPA: sigma-70 family RNA polymerase sigma factor [Pedobacter sp.]|uniref:RNA polymerase sigma factor n=1 Tax=Pedobacter sp. TaxID=1411316 RepID=UPI002BC095C2|nr:sigma-70 family RNA polymerase sigma factor [Pedobacter sp.]HMI02880.1 sigma-70 family RNA polymerase sigma factor [Pedobacter sp.]